MRRYLIRRPDQLAALASPMRQEIVDALARVPSASIAEIGAALGRPASGLYYHVRELVRVGLLVRDGQKRGLDGTRYRTVARELTIAYDPLSPANVARVSAAVGAMMRLGARDFRRGFAAEGVAVAGPRRELWAGRVTGWLTPSAIARVNGLMKEIYRIFRGSRPGSRERSFGMTLLLVPLERRLRKHGKEKRNASPL